jgi:large subunit ribosomal protein L18
MSSLKEIRRVKIKMRSKQKVAGTAEAPRLAVFRSNKNIYAQLINDTSGKTLVSAKYTDTAKINKVDQAKIVGKLIAEKALGLGVKVVKFDRSGYLYHGRIKSLADAARENGLQF